MGILSAFRFAFQNLFFAPILYGVIASLAVFSTVWDKGDRFKDQLTDQFRSQDDTFDFIVVGGGSAGAVLANRLSEFHTVLLLEAGGESHPFQAIPGLSIFLSKQPGTDWMHKSVTQTKSCYACRHKKYAFSQGKNLGGSGNLNYLIHLRGNPLDFDNWATITGDPSWGYEGVLPYFIQSEHFVGETTDKPAHGYGGPLQVQIPDYIGLAEEWNRAGVEMGYSHIDLNGRHSEGFDTVFSPIKSGVRQATYRSYIQPVRNRQSLLIRKFAHVNKVLIREGTNDAHGVEYDRHGHSKFAFANKEVILSAGTLQTPKLLILSGIGQQEHLNALHIPAKSVLPVGKNLQDHFATLLGPFYINKPKTISLDRDIDKQSFISFATSGKGPLTSSGFQATSMVTSSFAKALGLDGWPDIQLTLFGQTPHRMFYSDIGHAFGIREDLLRKYYGNPTGKENAFFIMVTVARPLSKGDFCVASKNPYKPAVIRPGYLDDASGQDLKVMVEGIHRALFLAENTTIFQGLETTYSQKCFPGCENVPFRSDAYWECYARSFSIAANDHVGTCAMGQIGSPYAVVDPQLRVQGTKRLRVVDASVMPTIVGAPTQAATIMIAEKAAALILKTWEHEAKTTYGVPGQTPGIPVPVKYGPPAVVQQYGPPSKPPPGSDVNIKYGPPANDVSTKYGPPPATNVNANNGVLGLSPPPISGGDGFANYDSFSVIRDQLNPKPGLLGTPTPTPLIPIPQDPQVWASPSPFPSASPDGFGSVGSTPVPFLSPEPSQVLLPPGETIPSTPESFSYSNVDFSGSQSIVSSTPTYLPPLDASRSDKVGNDHENDTLRQGKSFEGTVPPVPDGNQLGVGLENVGGGLFPSSTPTSPTFFSSSSFGTTPQSPFKLVTELVQDGPGFRVIRKRVRTTPRVVVHPRGHLGHQNVPRATHKELSESQESLFLTTSSARPVPKNIVKIRKRKPVPFRRVRVKTTTPTSVTTEPSPTENAETMVYGTYSGDAFENTTPIPPSMTLVPVLRPIGRSAAKRGVAGVGGGGGRRRLIRRKYPRLKNFNGEKRLRSRLHPEQSGIIVAQASSDVAQVEKIETEIDKRIDLNVDADVDYYSSGSIEEMEAINSTIYGKDDNTTTVKPEEAVLEKITLGEKQDNNATDIAVTESVVVFKDIELESGEELQRGARNSNVTKSLEQNLVPEESRNPIMRVDLNPIPEIVDPDAMKNINKTEYEATVAVNKNEYDDDEAEDEEAKNSASEVDDSSEYEYHEDDSYDNHNSSSSLNSSSIIISENNVSNITSISSPIHQKNVTSSPKQSPPPESEEVDYYSDETTETTTPKNFLQSISAATLNPRYMFRLRNKLIRQHA